MLVVYLNSATVDLFWLKGVLETVHAHIHIYIAQGPRTGQMSQTTCFLPSRGVRIFLLGVVPGLRAPTVQPPQSLACSSFAFWLLCGGCYRGWGGWMPAWEQLSGVPLLCPFLLTSHLVLLGNDWLNPKIPPGQTPRRTNAVGMLPALRAAHGGGLTSELWGHSL